MEIHPTVKHSPAGRRQRAVGYAPAEISALVNGLVVRAHADEAAFLWEQRSLAALAPHYKLDRLAKLDARVVAHLSGLLTAGPSAEPIVTATLADLDPGVLFVAAYLAFEAQAGPAMSRVLQLALTAPPLEAALRSALEWLPPNTVRPAMGRLLASHLQVHRRIGFAVLAAHRVISPSECAAGLEDEDADMRALALRAVGEARHAELDAACRRRLDDPDPACRFWAGWSLALLGDPQGAARAFDEGRRSPSLEAHALEVPLRCGEAGWARDVIRRLASEPSTTRAAVQAIGALGDPATVPWLIDRMADPHHGRIAGEAFSLLTGVDLAYADLVLDAEEAEEAEEDAAPVHPEDVDLRRPDRTAVGRWWATHQSDFVSGARYLAGLPVSADVAHGLLRAGYQRQRRAAAIELVRCAELPLFPIAQRADRQLRGLAR